ncbi:MAG: ATPase, partial [bacterium]|nr:ATPase [bacterium]
MHRGVIAMMLGAALVAAPGNATVLSSSDVGFVTQGSVDVAMSPDDAYALLTRPDRWWSSAHSISGDTKNLSLDPKVGGCFC